jgi:hypothetical protein
MSAEFVPFIPSQRSKPAPAAGSASFTPVQTTVRSTPPAPEPQIQVKRSGDRITHIQVQCRCGDQIEIECEY